MNVFLGGTCNDSNWRDTLIPMIFCDYFNPVVDDWTEEDQQIEIEKRESCDIVLYCITPKMTGVYSIAELVYDSCNRPKKTVFCYLEKDDKDEFNEHQIKSLEMVAKMIEENGCPVFRDLYSVAEYLNNQ